MTRPRNARRQGRTDDRLLVAVAEDTQMQGLRWLLAGPDRRLLVEGSLPGEAPPADVGRTVLVVPGQGASVRRLAVAARRPAQARAAALYLLAQDMTDAEDELVAAAGEPDVLGRRLAAAVRRDLLDDWLARAAAHGLTPDVILPDSLIPPAPDHDGWTALTLADRIALRGADAAFTAEPELAAAVAGERSVTPMTGEDQITEAVLAAAFAPPLNLLEGRAGEVRPDARRWRLAAALLAAIAAMPLIMMAAQALKSDLMARALDQRSREAVAAAWPDADPAADPAAETRRRAGAVLSGGFSGQAAALFAAVEATEGVTLESLLMDEGGELRGSLRHGDPGDLDALNVLLADQGLSLIAESTLQDEGRLLSDVMIGAAP